MTIRIDKPLFEHFVAASLLAPLVSLTVYHLLWGDSDVVFYGHALLVFGAFALATVNALTLAIWHFREVRPLALVGFGVMALRVLWLVGWDDVPEQHKFAYFLIAALGDAASAGALQVLLGR